MILHVTSLRGQLSTALSRDARRLRHVARHPGTTTLNDIEMLLRAHGVPEVKVWTAMDRLSGSEITPPIAWAFAMEYDGAELAEVLMTTTPGSGVGRHVDGAPGLSGL